jgi:carbonic anhydrase
MASIPVVQGAAQMQRAAGPGIDGAAALDMLMAGNRRFAGALSVHPDQSPNRRFTVSMGQHPFATVLTCADSRVPPEVVFDQGLGDLFTVRVAGNIVDDAVLGSIEYAALHLNTRLVLVLGHERCGAVEAALRAEGAEGHVGSLVSAIRPAIESSREERGDALDNAVRANVRLVASQIRNSQPVLAGLIARGTLRVAGARYDLETGIVDLVK